MKPVIPLISQMSEKEVQHCLELFATILPEEKVVPASMIPSAEKSQCDIAIVANPNPKDVAEFAELQWVQSLWAGVEQLVLELDNPSLHIVRLIDPSLAKAMAEAVLAWTLYLHRDMPRYASQQRSRVWHSLPYCPAQERTVGILGLGELGQASARQLALNGFKVLGWSRRSKQIPDIISYSGEEGFQSLLEHSQILVCLLPLTKETHQLLDKKALAQLPKGASMINFSRGAIVHIADLVDQLDSGHLAHAVLDVFDQEPLCQESSLWSHPQITVLPHISAPTQLESALQIVAQNIRQYRQTGELPATVDKLRGY